MVVMVVCGCPHVDHNVMHTQSSSHTRTRVHFYTLRGGLYFITVCL